MRTVQCPQCKRHFLPRDDRQKHCNVKCKNLKNALAYYRRKVRAMGREPKILGPREERLYR